MSSITKRLLAFERRQLKTKRLVLENQTLNDQDINCLVTLLNDQYQLQSLALDFCTLNISEHAFCKLINAVKLSNSLLQFRLTGRPAGNGHKFLIDNPNKLNAIRDLIIQHHSLKELSLMNLIYNRHYIQRIVNEASANKNSNPVILEFGAVLVDLPRVAAEVDRLNEAAAQAANDKKIDQKIKPEQAPAKRDTLFDAILENFKSKLGLLRFNDPKLILPQLL